MNEYHTISAIQSDLAQQRITCVKLVHHYLDRIRQWRHLNAFLEVYEKEAIERAEEIDRKIAEGNGGKLHGLVIALKDVICYKGHKVSASSRILEGFTSLYNATVTQRLLDEDAIIIGRTNCDEFAMGGSNENSAYGNVLNYLDETKVPGGSSGGSVVAVQAGLCHASLGTDTGGSIRQPSSFCGTVGIKPTYGRVSRYGIVAYASSFDQVGPVTNSVEDAALILEVISGKDNMDSTLSRREVPAYSQSLTNYKKPRIAYFRETLEQEGINPEIREFIEKLLEDLRNDGCQVEAVKFPYLEYMVPAYYVLTTAEASSNLARYDGVHYGYSYPEAKEMEEVYTETRTHGFGAEVKRRIMLGTFVLSAGYYDAYYSKAQRVRRIIKETTENILKEYDFILLPTTPTTAFGIGEKTKNPVEMYLADIFTVQAPLAGLPAISLPLGRHSNGLPFGVQLMAPKFEEASLLTFSHYLLHTKS